MKDFLKQDYLKVKVVYNILMEIFIKVCSNKANGMVKVYINLIHKDRPLKVIINQI